MNRVYVRPLRQTVPVWNNSLFNDPFFNEAFNWVFNTPRANGNAKNGTTNATFRVNLYQDNDNFYVYALLPGADASKFDITTLDNKLTIAGEISEKILAPQTEGVQALHRELPESRTTKFERSFELPTAIDAEKVVASYDNSVLQLTLPKAPQAKAHRISVGGSNAPQLIENN